MKSGRVLMVLFGVGFGLALCAGPASVVLTACTPQQAQSALDVVPVISADLCKLAEDVPGMPGWVYAVCKVVDGQGNDTGREVKFPILASSPQAAALKRE